MHEKRKLIAFDFDHTIVNENSDIVAANLLPNKSLITPEIKALINSVGGWTSYMQAIFVLLQENSITKSNILNAINKIPQVNEMSQTIKSLKTDHNFDIIIVSDSNSQFIDSWCKANDLTDSITQIFTNPASFSGDDLLTIKPYTNQTDCKMCTRNLCKGNVLQTFVKQQHQCDVEYDRIVYVGDGRNDMCPIFGLKNDCDIGCARVGYYLDKNIEQYMQKTNRLLAAKLIRWSDGNDLYAQILEHL